MLFRSLRTLTFNPPAHIHEQVNRKPLMNLTVDITRLEEYDELRLVCATGNLVVFCRMHDPPNHPLDGSNVDHQWIFDDQVPRSKVTYDVTTDEHTTIMIIPDFDIHVDSGNYQCSARNAFGSTTQTISIDRKNIKG